jgi:antitoxin HicB
MSEYPFTVRPLSAQEGCGYLVAFPDLPGCMSDGDTIEEAIANAQDAKRDWVSAMQEAGRAIPPASVDLDESYSGKWQLRAPRSLHRRLAERAKREGVSLNTLVVTLLAEGLGQRNSRSPEIEDFPTLRRAFQDIIESALRDAAKAPNRIRSVSAGRPKRGTTAQLVEEVLQSNAPRALRPAEIRSAIQRDKGVEMAFTSIRHALGQLEQRRVIEQIGDTKAWRYQPA